MNCKQCNGILSPKQTTFCSTKCKADFQRSKPKVESDQDKQIKCKLTNKIFDYGVLRSGYLKKYSMTVLNKEYDERDFEIISKIENTDKYWNCPHCDWKCKCDGVDKSGWIGKHLLDKHNIDKINHVKKFPNDSVLWPHRLNVAIKQEKILSHEDNRVQCLECGEWFSSISNTHLQQKHNGMTQDEYKKKHNVDTIISFEYRTRLQENYYKNDNLLNSNVWRSRYETEICNILSDLGINYVPNDKKTFGFDIDIYVPDFKLAIEFNGLYYHSEYAGGKTEYYHLNKTKMCESNGLHLVHIFEDEWVHKKEIIISRLKNLLGKTDKIIYARKCELKEIDYSMSSTFLDENHIQGKLTTSKANLGLFHNNELVSIMTFGKMRNSTGSKLKVDSEWELQRFCNKINHSVIGGAGKLIKYFEETYKPTKIVSFADRRWTSTLKRSLYDELNFTLTSLGSPNYWYLVEPMKRTHRFTYTKQNILNKFPKSDPNKTEWENMVNLGFDRIWDCGSLKYEKVYDNSEVIVDTTETIEQPKNRPVKRRRKRKETNRNIIDVECPICNNSYSIVGIASHFKLNHGFSVDEIVEKYGEYRPDKLKLLEMSNLAKDKYECKICNFKCRNEKHLTTHLTNSHNMPKIDYVKEYILNDVIPLCKCGCGTETKIMTSFPYYREFISGHNSNVKK